MKKLACLIYLLLCFYNIFSYEMIYVNGGCFHREIKQMDCYGDKFSNDILVSSFMISRTELSIAEYKLFCTEKSKALPKQILEMFNEKDLREYPIYYISFIDGIEFCNWLSKRENLEPCYKIGDNQIIWNDKANGYRLPTEAEWEYAACCGGEDKSIISDNFNEIEKYIKTYDFNDRDDDLYEAHKIKKYEPNKFGLYDVLDNVAEWCWDYYNIQFFEENDGKQLNTSKGPSESFEVKYLVSPDERVVKGGIELKEEYYTLNPIKWVYGLSADTTDRCIGIRLARNGE